MPPVQHLLKLGFAYLLGVGLAIVTVFGFGRHASAAEPLLEKHDLFVANTDGYKLYRIPGIVVTKKGTVLVYCEARRSDRGDWGEINILMRRSTDGGKTFSPAKQIVTPPADAKKNPAALAQKLANEKEITCNNPVFISHSQTGRVTVLYCIEYARCFVMHSDDDGQTFGPPVEITSTFEAFRKQYNWTVLATGPGHAIQLTSGRLVVPVWLSLGTGGHAHRPSVTATIYSDDQGQTWQRGDIAIRGNADIINPNETIIAQLADDRVLLNCRSESRVHRRLVTTSADGATKWSAPQFHADLPEPICMAGIVRVSKGTKPNRLLFSNPDWLARADGKEAPGVGRDRKNVSLRLSYDEGTTWPVKKALEPGFSGYSDVAAAEDGMLFCLYERGSTDGTNIYKTGSLTLARFNLEWLTDGRDSWSRTTPPQIAPASPVPVKKPVGERKKMAGIVTEYRHNSHADVILSRLFLTDTLDGKGNVSPLELVSLYTDQVPQNDTSRKFSEQYRFRICDTVEQALTLGTDKLAVDGVMLIAEHGNYPKSAVGQTEFPKRRLFEQVVSVFRKTGRVVPVFMDKHLSDNWTDIDWIYRTAREMKIPMMAGSSIPVAWRIPANDVTRGDSLKEVVVLSYHTLDAYGFHAVELAQGLVERRKGGETGVAACQSLSGEKVWAALKANAVDPELLKSATAALSMPRAPRDQWEKLVKDPLLCTIEYRDGLKVHILTLNGAVAEWSAAWRDPKGAVRASLFDNQDARPFMHFTFLLHGVEQMMLTGKPAWPVERTLYTSGTLDALHISRTSDGTRIETPYLNLPYTTDSTWRQPPDPPLPRALNDQ